MDNGWDRSAAAWIAHVGDEAEYSRRYVLDPAMMARLEGRGFARAIDVGCGEGRFCRKMAGLGIATVGIDPTEALLAEARRQHGEGDYRSGRAEALDFPDAGFDLVVSCLSLVDIPDARSAIAEMARVLSPGGSLLIANLNGFASACGERSWVKDDRGRRLHMAVDNYLDERALDVSWSGIRIQNWHRPLSLYMQALLREGLVLIHFDEPGGQGGPSERIEQHRRAPYFHVMEWRKPTA